MDQRLFFLHARLLVISVDRNVFLFGNDQWRDIKVRRYS